MTMYMDVSSTLFAPATAQLASTALLENTLLSSLHLCKFTLSNQYCRMEGALRLLHYAKDWANKSADFDTEYATPSLS